MNPLRRILTPSLAGVLAFMLGGITVRAADLPAAHHFQKNVRPILMEYCSDCHADGMKKGGVAFDQFADDEAVVTNRDLWAMVLKNVRGGIMPPPKKSRPSADEQARLVSWIKSDIFEIDPKNPDPGRVTVRRLNRVEYHNTIHDLIGVDFDTELEFPPDDTGYGFDNIGDVLTLSPMLLEKYVSAARTIISQAVPDTSRVMPVHTIPGQAFHHGATATGKEYGALRLSYYDSTAVSNRFNAAYAGQYQLLLTLTANEQYVDDQFDSNQCRMVFKVDGQELVRQSFGREGNKEFRFDFKKDWLAGPHDFAVEITPLTPGAQQVRSLNLRIQSVAVTGPMDEKYWVPPADYHRFFTRETVPADAHEKRLYAREILGKFATRAFRRPVEDETLDRLTDLAEETYSRPGAAFEGGVSHAMMAILSSPDFLFREEGAEPADKPVSLIDEYSLASRLSYFLWSTMPDDELMRLAGAGQLRQNLDAQVKRMLADPRADALAKNFTGQWLQTRDIDTIALDPRTILTAQDKKDPAREEKRRRFRELAAKDSLTPEEKVEFEKMRGVFFKTFSRNGGFTDQIRHDMRREAELYFSNIVRQDRSISEFISSDYTYLNEKLAKFYGLTNLGVTGTEMRRVTLPTNSARGGVLTMGTVLAVTSNPTRTSPVKRGLFILDNILGNPVPPPPPNLPALEDSEKDLANHEPTLREVLALHRDKPLCASCHNRMDPIGLALENFNAMGMWRETDHGQPIDSSGVLISGESFQDIHELKHILVTKHLTEFYRTLTEKMLTYALGRGLEYSDTGTVDEIVDRLSQENGRFSVLLNGVIESLPFQKRRNLPMQRDTPSGTIVQRADLIK